MKRWASSLNFAYKQLAAGLSGDDVRNDWVRIETDSTGKDRLVLTGLEKLDEPASLTALRADVDARIPVVDLSEAVLEVRGPTCAPRSSPSPSAVSTSSPA
ncbi:hypothetical protein J2853_001395 [Streptosporangium lutulentum]|uniref:Uncharacterized protein n=1 Tax=Streptosporangium lutulentum TaxID=1461250 RepID=A0ABT9Q8A6_9ACTN|nr:hypothetical protein [Streptosporangium lutulentum]MDP9842184.1 hypothetical protein [Streptosporangium lutulentum]